MEKYLDYQSISKIIGEILLDPSFEPMSQDSYNETKIAAKVKESKQETILLMAAINMATIGYGNQRYGNFRISEKVYDIATVLRQNNVKTNLPQGSLLKEDDLTPGRLCRFFRYHIRDYIRKTNLATYLYRKYSSRKKEFNEILFRGSEYLDDLTKEQQEELLITYRTLDLRLNTKLEDRIVRVFEAKGFIKVL